MNPRSSLPCRPLRHILRSRRHRRLRCWLLRRELLRCHRRRLDQSHRYHPTCRWPRSNRLRSGFPLSSDQLHPRQQFLRLRRGWLEAFAQLGQTHVHALVVKANKEDRYIMSLVENIARQQPHALEVVRDIAALEAQGYSPAEVGAKIGIHESYVRGILRLHAKGEQVLLAAVERGELPIAVAVNIAWAKDGDIRRCLAEAYERGELKGKALVQARAIAERRAAGIKRISEGGSTSHKRRKRISADELIRAYKRSTQKQALLVKRAQVCESRLQFVCGALRELAKDENFVTLLRAEKLDKMPKYLAEQLKSGASR